MSHNFETSDYPRFMEGQQMEALLVTMVVMRGLPGIGVNYQKKLGRS